MKPARAWLRSCLGLALGLGPSLSAFAAPHLVVIEGMRFAPQVLQVKPGDTITWENRDMVAHNVTARAGPARSGILSPGQSWRYTVPPGTSFDYLCTLHPMMTGRVEIGAAAAASRAGRPGPLPKMK